MMKADFSRWTFDPKKHYRRVLMQQGRVQVDADWNEQQAINHRSAEVEALDVIGRCGAPLENAGFKITINDQGELVIGKGRYYVDGVLCENENDVAYLNQPDLPDPPKPSQLLTGTQPLGIVYLDVWERHITALDDPRIRDVALNGPDTAARSCLVWQVKILPVKPISGLANCGSQFPEWDALNASSTAALNARTQPPGVESPCLIPPTVGYQRLENQLYRVEVHNGGAFGVATFKWSRDNGSVVTAIEKINGQEITVSSVGPDSVLGFSNGQWVEIVDDRIELSGQPGQLLQVSDVNPATRVIKLAAAATAVNLNPKLRRWDSAGEIKTANNWIAIEGGIEVQFSAGDYRSGDFWLIPARTATGEIEWPPFQTPNTSPIAQPPLGIMHHYCRLALLSFASGGVQVTEDCRPLFPPLTNSGIHVAAINLIAGTRTLVNDDKVTATELAQGIRIMCDTELFGGSVLNKPVCTVTLDLPFPFNSADRQLWGEPVIGTQPLVLSAILKVEENVISWTPENFAQVWLVQRLFSMMTELQRGDRLLAHLTLKGNFIWAKSDPSRYLDGEVFGFRTPRDTRTAARLPSGDGWRGGDLEMWFWLTPPSATLLKVSGVRILGVGTNPNNPNPQIIFTMINPMQPITIPLSVAPNAIEASFTAAVDAKSVVSGTSFEVSRFDSASGAVIAILPGQVLFTPNPSTVRWVFQPPAGNAAPSLPSGTYRVTLRGNGASVITAQGAHLDGEPGQRLPSGDNVAGGDFTFNLTVG